MPRCLSYFLQRPESHCVHHGLGIVRNNYVDLPIFDILFGSFVNPEKAMETGFYQGASYPVGDMLLCKDVYEENYMLFGSFVNPKQAMETGFYQGASYRMGDMLLFKDVYAEDVQPDAAELNVAKCLARLLKGITVSRP